MEPMGRVKPHPDTPTGSSQAAESGTRSDECEPCWGFLLHCSMKFGFRPGIVRTSPARGKPCASGIVPALALRRTFAACTVARTTAAHASGVMPARWSPSSSAQAVARSLASRARPAATPGQQCAMPPAMSVEVLVTMKMTVRLTVPSPAVSVNAELRKQMLQHSAEPPGALLWAQSAPGASPQDQSASSTTRAPTQEPTAMEAPSMWLKASALTPTAHGRGLPWTPRRTWITSPVSPCSPSRGLGLPARCG